MNKTISNLNQPVLDYSLNDPSTKQPYKAILIKVVYPDVPGMAVIYTLEYPDGKQRERLYSEFVFIH